MPLIIFGLLNCDFTYVFNVCLNIPISVFAYLPLLLRSSTNQGKLLKKENPRYVMLIKENTLAAQKKPVPKNIASRLLVYDDGLKENIIEMI